MGKWGFSRAELLRTALSDFECLHRLVNDLLDISRLESRSVRLKKRG